MFWRFGFHQASPLESILEREHFTLVELLDEEDVLQECKALNRKLVEFLAQPDVVSDLLTYAISETTDEDPKIQYKYPFVACEVLSSELTAVFDTIFAHEHLQDQLFSVLDRDESLNPLLAGYFSKIVTCLLNRKTYETLAVMQKKDMLTRLLQHIGTFSIMELLLKLLHETEEMRGPGEELEWIYSSDIVQKLLSRFSSDYDSDVHAHVAHVLVGILHMSNACQCTLTAQLREPTYVNTLIDLIIAGPGSARQHAISVLIEILNQERPKPEQEVPIVVTQVIGRLDDFVKLVQSSASESILGAEVTTTHGTLKPPLGSTRLKTIELFVEMCALVHRPVMEQLHKLGVFQLCLTLFMKYEMNNFLHNMVMKMFDALLESPFDDLKVQVLQSCGLIEKLVEAHSLNEAALATERGIRKGYMGHVTRLSNTILAAARMCLELQQLLDSSEPWATFKQNYLETQNSLEARPLGGHKPIGATDDSDDDDLYIPSQSGGSDQFLSEDLEQFGDEDGGDLPGASFAFDHGVDLSSSYEAGQSWQRPVGDDDDDGSAEKWSGKFDALNGDGFEESSPMAAYEPNWQANFEQAFPPASVHGTDTVDDDAATAWATFDDGNPSDDLSRFAALQVGSSSTDGSDQATGTSNKSDVVDDPGFNQFNFWKINYEPMADPF